MFVYTGLTATSFTGCSGLNQDHVENERVTIALESDTSIYDDDNLLGKLGDRIYKANKTDKNALYSQEEIDRVSKAYLKEFYKDHTKVKVNCAYSPFIKVGHTVNLIDSYNNISRNYFVESIKDTNGMYELTLAYYP